MRHGTGFNQRGAIVLRARLYHGETVPAPSSDTEDELQDLALHKEGKEERAAVFAAWLIDTFGRKLLCGGCGVVDVAAGKGMLSAELCWQLDYSSIAEVRCEKCGPAQGTRWSLQNSDGELLHCTLVEPAPRDGFEELKPPNSSLLVESFDSTFPASHLELSSGCSIFVGLHPDQPTEAIVDVALALGKPFAVVPCCVFSNLFPLRQQATGQHVVGYGSFIRYLKAKDPRIESARLNFQGRNRVLFCRATAASVASAK